MNELLTPVPKSPMKVKYIIAIVAFFLIIALYFGWVSYWSSDAKANRELGQKIERANQAMADFKTAMRNDTYGGKTPEETLNMFIDALKKGDVELASKYFMLDTNTKSPNYLTRTEWENNLSKLKADNKVAYVLDLATRMKPSISNNTSEDGDFEFVTYSKKGLVETSLFMVLNQQANVWKIASF